MTSTSVNPTTGAKRISDSDAPDTAGNYNELADDIVARGLAGKGTTAQRDAYAFGKEGDLWSNTTTDSVDRHDGTGWSAFSGPQANVTVSGVSGTTTAGTAVSKTVDGWVHGHVSLSRNPLSAQAPLAIVQAGSRPASTYTTVGAVLAGGVATPVVVQVATNGNIQYFGAPGGNTNLQFDIEYPAGN